MANLVPRARNANALDLIHVGVVAQSCRVDDVQRHAFDLNGLLHHITRGARNGRDDGQLGTGQRIEQGAFACVGLARNDHANALTQQRALTGLLRHTQEVGLQAVQLTLGIGLFQKVDVFFGKVQRGFHQHAQVD